MAEIKLNQEMICALQNCKNAKEIIALAKTKGIEMSEEQAEKLYAMLQNDKLSDENLKKVTGGNTSNGKICPKLSIIPCPKLIIFP